ncbi:hypothetical protein [Hydrogenophaga pseudoflava]|uniref:hypothetical protein n=1 Tax=Hydrogenophaga pseudoflava TaxID=47421 RepID=UPI0027E517E8|nr:hypothetical protein [Hydrogenophaga pseudoflava]MDQ7746342.1 hypothetical protein [Hydrogenophaga pseudoflava]
MASTATHADKTNAADKSIGFDYQYYYFLLQVLNLKVGQSVGFEVKDDVHTELGQNRNIFYQLKHTTQVAANGQPVALTKLDKDMWKTFYNWAMVITDKVAGREQVEKQLEFTRQSEFHLVANKKHSNSNTIFEAISKLQANSIAADAAKLVLEAAEQSTTDDGIKNYINKILSLDLPVLESFLLSIKFELDVADIVGLVKQAVQEFHIETAKVPDVLAAIDSNLRAHIFQKVKDGEAVILSFEDFHAKFRKHFNDARSTKLTIKSFLPSMPDDLFSQVFIKRLLEVKYLNVVDVEIAADLTTKKLQLAMHLDHWDKMGEVTSKDISTLHDNVRTLWQGKFRADFIDCEDKDIEKIGRGILREMLGATFPLCDDVLSIQHSNGEIYHLSDIGRIGWHKDWETK